MNIKYTISCSLPASLRFLSIYSVLLRISKISFQISLAVFSGLGEKCFLKFSGKLMEIFYNTYDGKTHLFLLIFPK